MAQVSFRLLSSLALPKSADRLPCHPARSQVRRAPGTEKPPLVGTVPGNFCFFLEPPMRGGLSLVCGLSHSFQRNQCWLSPTPLKNHGVKVSWDDDSPNIWKNKIHVPNHQEMLGGLHLFFSTGSASQALCALVRMLVGGKNNTNYSYIYQNIWKTIVNHTQFNHKWLVSTIKPQKRDARYLCKQ